MESVEFTVARNPHGNKYTAWLVTCTLCEQRHEAAIADPYVWARNHINDHHLPQPKFVLVETDGSA